MRRIVCFAAILCGLLVSSTISGRNDSLPEWGPVEDSCRPFVRWWGNGDKLQKEEINKVSLIAFTKNDIGNAFWHTIGWTERLDLNYYDFVLNSDNIVNFNIEE